MLLERWKENLLKSRENLATHPTSEPSPAPSVASLADRVTTWWISETHRGTEYNLATLAKTFDTIPRLLGPILLNLGWERGRRKASRRSCSNRFWMPPKGD